MSGTFLVVFLRRQTLLLRHRLKRRSARGADVLSEIWIVHREHRVAFAVIVAECRSVVELCYFNLVILLVGYHDQRTQEAFLRRPESPHIDSPRAIAPVLVDPLTDFLGHGGFVGRNCCRCGVRKPSNEKGCGQDGYEKVFHLGSLQKPLPP